MLSLDPGDIYVPPVGGGWIPPTGGDVAATVTGALKVQYQDGAGDWIDFGGAHDLGSVLRTRRFALNPGQAVTARKWRLVVVGGHDWGAAKLRLDSLTFHVEAQTPGDLSAVKLWTFAYDDADQRYTLVSTAGNLEVHHGGARVASMPSPYSEAQLKTAQRCQALDTLLAFHPDVQPLRFMRQGSHSEWDARFIAFDNPPLYDFDGTHLNGRNEVQRLYFVDYADGDTFELTLEGQTTGAITWTAAGAMAAVETALEALDGVGVGGVEVTGSATDMTLTYGGKLAFSDVGTIAGRTIVSDKGEVLGSTTTEGLEGGEPVISATRGWPACGTFYQQRLYLGGLKSRPQSLLASIAGGYFDLLSKTADDDAGIDETADTDEVNTIRALFPGRHLQVMTSSAEFYIPSEPITPKSFALKRGSRRGIQPGTAPIDLSGTTVFVCAGGDALADFAYDITADSYEAPYLSADASHIVQGVTDLALRRSRSTTRADLAIMPKADGTAVCLVAMTDQNVAGFTPWATQGKFLAAGAELLGDLYVACARQTGDGHWLRTLERLDDARVLDGGVTGGADLESLGGLEHLNGRTVALYIDGADAGDAVVAGGAVALPYPSLRSVEAGLLFQTEMVLLPFVQGQDPRGGASQKPRVGIIDLRLGPTANLKGGLVGGRAWRVPLKTRPNALLDSGPGEDAFKGWTRLWGVPGFRSDAQVRLVQERPGPLQVLEVVASITS